MSVPFGSQMVTESRKPCQSISGATDKDVDTRGLHSDGASFASDSPHQWNPKQLTGQPNAHNAAHVRLVVAARIPTISRNVLGESAIPFNSHGNNSPNENNPEHGKSYRGAACPSSYKVGHQSGFSIGGSGLCV